MQKRFSIFLLFFTLISFSARDNRLKNTLDSFKLEPGLRLELAVSEPLVIDPVAFAFDEKKKLYVVEDRGYPDPIEEGAVPTKLGQVACLEDTNGDGKYDRRTTFVSGLTYPNGILLWRGGAFVTCAPDIYYFKDTTGDGVADIRKVVLTGFNANKTGQIRVSTPVLGLDGFVYVSGGLNSGNITSPEYPKRAPVSFASGDGRFNPETFEFQVTGGVSQFGLTFDPYGRRFGCSNRHPMQHMVMEPWQLRRNPHLLFTETYQDVSNAEAEAKVFPISHAKTSADFIPKLIGRSHTGTFTSACGLILFNGTGLTQEHRGNAFICEPAQNLIQRQVVYPDGVSFRSKLPYEGRDFLASSDEWFRPVFLQSGPEGALYIADMHRKVIDHPSYVPEEARPGLDFESGKTMGRIYRVVRHDFHDPAPGNQTSFDSASSSVQIAKALDSQNEWTRNTSFRLLLERKDLRIVPVLRELALAAKYGETRTAALWLLQFYNALDESIVKQSLGDIEPGVREQAVLLAAQLSVNRSGLLKSLLNASLDTSMRVRFNTAMVLGDIEDPEVVDALANIAAKDGGNRWMRAAILSGIGSRLTQFMTRFNSQKNTNSAAYTPVMQDLGRLLGNSATLETCRAFLKQMLQSKGGVEWRTSSVLGLAEGLRGRQEMQASSEGVLSSLLQNSGANSERMLLNQFIKKVALAVQNKSTPANLRIAGTNLLGYTQFDLSGNVLKTLLAATNPPDLQLAAVASLARLGDVRGGYMLTEKNKWVAYTPRVRSAVIAALVSKPAFMDVLFNAIRKGIISAPEISSTDRERLLQNKNPEVSKQAKILFSELEGGERMKVYEDYKNILLTNGDAVAGKKTFLQLCATCHSHSNKGGKVGPDLTGVSNQPGSALLLHILVPNYEVLPAYQAILVETKDGRSISGRLLAETENSITIRTAFGTDESILRTNITSLVNSGLSLMPDGLERTVSKDEMRNLIAFLKAG